MPIMFMLLQKWIFDGKFQICQISLLPTVEKCWCFLSHNLLWLNFLTWDDIKNIFGYTGYVYAITKMNLWW
jgi:hypothetical protein